jgi:Tfp pilus assembly protein FimT
MPVSALWRDTQQKLRGIGLANAFGIMAARVCTADREHPSGRVHIPFGVRGYTAIELLATIGLIAAVTAMAIPHFDPARMQINAAQRLLIANLRVARTNAITRSVHYRVEFPTTSQIRVQRMILVANAWQPDSSGVQNIALPGQTTLPSSLVGTNIEFNTRGMAVNLAAPQQIDITDTFGVTKSLQAWPSGQINGL